MPPEDDLMTSLSALMDINEALTRQLSISTSITNLSFEDVTPELWSAIQDAQGENRYLIEMFLAGFAEAPKIVSNDAIVSHINAVITAD